MLLSHLCAFENFVSNLDLIQEGLLHRNSLLTTIIG